MTECEQGDRRKGDAASPVDDEVIAALADEDRRVVVYYLREHGTASLADLADVVAGTTRTSPVASQTDHEQARTELHHKHLPALDGVGLVSYDAADQTARLATLSSAVETLLEWAAERDRP